jgi:alcohol dehydrogenase class IV
MLHAPHGALCARLLPFVMEANIKALETRQPKHPALARYAEIARILTGEKEATPSDGAKWTSELVKALNIPPLSVYGMSQKDFPEAVDKTLKANSFKGNPIPLSEHELMLILEQAL